MEVSLLDYVAGMLGVYISDLKIPVFQHRALYVLSGIREKRFPMKEWNTALSYIFRCPCELTTFDEVRQFLSQR
ncbi:hypothetical protein LJC20_05100 [Eubacteriales bacterium OttesenSCG-928-M02]|nr:hypothetical protein [Eubacteriales bacterium OttesenSCG-928-M02]